MSQTFFIQQNIPAFIMVMAYFSKNIFVQTLTKNQ